MRKHLRAFSLVLASFGMATALSAQSQETETSKEYSERYRLNEEWLKLNPGTVIHLTPISRHSENLTPISRHSENSLIPFTDYRIIEEINSPIRFQTGNAHIERLEARKIDPALLKPDVANFGQSLPWILENQRKFMEVLDLGGQKQAPDVHWLELLFEADMSEGKLSVGQALNIAYTLSAIYPESLPVKDLGVFDPEQPSPETLEAFKWILQNSSKFVRPLHPKFVNAIEPNLEDREHLIHGETLTMWLDDAVERGNLSPEAAGEVYKILFDSFPKAMESEGFVRALEKLEFSPEDENILDIADQVERFLSEAGAGKEGSVIEITITLPDGSVANRAFEVTDQGVETLDPNQKKNLMDFRKDSRGNLPKF